ncbi:MAG: GDP-mannose 4,6-dehydratase [Actinomycetota bacterium]
MRVLITGVTGFAGGHLARLCRERGAEVHGLLGAGMGDTAPDGVVGHEAQLRMVESVRRVLADAAPDRVFHLAGASSVGQSFTAPMPTWEVNLGGTLALLEALRLEGSTATCVAVTSGEVYGRVAAGELPVTEDMPMTPVSPYGASKAAADLAVESYARAFDLRAVRVRAFNHLGPGQDPRFVVPTVALQIAEAEAREDEEVVVRLGNVDTRRDFSDVRDVVRAYWAIAESGDPAVPYLVCSGRSVSIRDIVDVMAGLARCRVSVVSDPSRRREGELADLYGSPSRLTADTGWQPEIPLETTLRDTLDHWRARARKEG